MTEALLYEFIGRVSRSGKQPTEAIIRAFLMQLDKLHLYEKLVRFCFYHWGDRNNSEVVKNFVYQSVQESKIAKDPSGKVLLNFIKEMKKYENPPNDTFIYKYLKKIDKLDCFEFLIRFCFYHWEDRHNKQIICVFVENLNKNRHLF